jgi:competence protein ComEC
LARKKIFLQGYVSAQAWEEAGEKGGSFIFRIANQMRNRFLAIFAAANMDINESGVISAILLGSDDKLDPNLAQSYASTGVSHILCVSGMHVGILYMMLAFLLKLLNRNKQQRIIRSVILVLTIWLYACITGLFPSVMRAATMFTFVALAGLLERNTNTYNSLLGSLLFLLIINPFLLFQVGFQFSYLAVFGIVWLQPPLKSLYNPRTKVGGYFWNIMMVSLAAQLLVAPLSMFYFHRFPNYFLLTNVAIISLAPVVVIGGITVLASSFWDFAYHWLSQILVYIIKTMNWIVVHIEAFPHSVTANIHISVEQVILFYGLILLVFYAFLYKNKTALFLSLSFAIGLTGMGIHKIHQTNSQQMLLFYHTKSGCIIDCIDGKTSSLFGDTSAVFDAEIYRYNVENNHIYHQISKVNTLQNQRFISFNGETVFILLQPLYPSKNNPKIKIDYLLLSHKNISLEAIKNIFDFQLLIFDSALPYYKTKQLKAACEEESIAFHDLKKDGAVVVNL